MAYIDKHGVEFSDNKRVLIKCPKNYIGEYVIPQGVIMIADYAFECCNGLTSVIIPDTVVSIGKGVFDGCNNLAYINIPNSVCFIGDSFEYGNIKFPIYNAYHFVRLPSSYSGVYIMPDGITEICEGAFYECEKITSVIIPDSVLFLDDFAFAHCESLTNIVIPWGVKKIGEGLFKDCINLISVTIPDSVTNIGEQAFSGCYNLKCINFPNKLEEIGEDAFMDCMSLSTIILPETIDHIGAGAFAGCTGLRSITNMSKEPLHITEDVFDEVDKTMCKLRIPRESVEQYWLSDGWDLFDNLLYKKDCYLPDITSRLHPIRNNSLLQIVEWNQCVRKEIVRLNPNLTIQDWERIENKLRQTTESIMESTDCETYASNLLL